MEVSGVDDLEPIELSEEDQQEILQARGNIRYLMDEYRSTYDDVEHYNNLVKKRRAKLRALAEAMYDVFLAEGLERGSSSDATFKPELLKRVAVKKENEEAAFAALEQVGLGGIIKRTVNFQTLNKAYRDGGLTTLDAPTLESNFSTWEEKVVHMRRKSGSIPTE